LIISQAHKAVMVNNHIMPAINLTRFDRTKQVTYKGEDFTVLPDSLDTFEILSKENVTYAGPITRYYSWPGQFTPFDHQIETSDFLCRHRRAFVFNSIGTGKSLSALWAADYLRRQGKVRKTLIVATLSTLWRVWADEIYKNFPGITFAVLHGSRQKRLSMLSKDKDFYIINHDGMKVLQADLDARDDIDLVILDEGAQFRNAKTDKYKSLDVVAGVKSNRRLWWLTGSPMPNAPTDIWAQARMINPDLVPRYFSRFRDQVMTQRNQFLWVPKPNWEQQIYAMLKPSIRYTRDQCLDLPPCITEVREVEMSKDQEKAYKSMCAEFIAEMKGGTVIAVNEGVRRNKLIQIATGYVYDQNGVTHDLNCSAKYKALIEAVEESGNKAIIFTPYRHSAESIAKQLKSKYTVGMVHGGVSTPIRSKIFSDFQDGDLQLIVAHPGCMAHGLTLTASSTIIWWGPVDSYEIYEQAIGRITRPGQKLKQTIVHLVCSDIEKKVYKRLGKKESMQGLLLELLNT